MSMKGVEKKKPPGLVIIERRQEVIVLLIGKPLAAFSMMALFAMTSQSHIQIVCQVSFSAGNTGMETKTNLTDQ